MLFGNGADGCELAAARVREENVETALFLLDLCVKPVEIGKNRRVRADSSDVGTNGFNRRIEFRLTASGDIDVGAFRDKLLAVARPMPVLPPVTSAIFPSSFFDMQGSPGCTFILYRTVKM